MFDCGIGSMQKAKTEEQCKLKNANLDDITKHVRIVNSRKRRAQTTFAANERKKSQL